MQADGNNHTNRNNKFHVVLFRREEVVCVRLGETRCLQQRADLETSVYFC